MTAERSGGATAAGGGTTGDEQVGSVGEEAAKLLNALQDWARDTGSQHVGAVAEAAAAATAAARATRAAEHVDGHLAGEQHGRDEVGATPADCRYCPVCGVVAAVRATPPEVRAHLSSAASSLVKAAAELLATAVPDHRPERPEPPARDEEDGSWD